ARIDRFEYLLHLFKTNISYTFELFVSSDSIFIRSNEQFLTLPRKKSLVSFPDDVALSFQFAPKVKSRHSEADCAVHVCPNKTVLRYQLVLIVFQMECEP